MWEIPRSQQQQIPPHWMSYILVENLEESLKKVSQNGGLLKVPTTPMGDFGQFAIIIDPTGAPIALWESLRK